MLQGPPRTGAELRRPIRGGCRFLAVRPIVEFLDEIQSRDHRGDLLARPGSNHGEVVELARKKGLSKNQAEAAVTSGPWQTKPGKGREIRYYVEDEEFDSIKI